MATTANDNDVNARVYLDHAATTPVDPRVVEAMLPCYAELWGNPSSVYQEGQAARRALDQARDSVAAILGARPGEVIFSAGGSESDNHAIRGAGPSGVRLRRRAARTTQRTRASQATAAKA